MPTRAARPCKHPGCRALATDGRFCAKHAESVAAVRPYDRWRGSPESRGYDRAWRKLRLVALARDGHRCTTPDCGATERLEVHHIIPIELAPNLRLVLTNLVTLCKSCHSAITATRDSSFARRGPRP